MKPRKYQIVRVVSVTPVRVHQDWAKGIEWLKVVLIVKPNEEMVHIWAKDEWKKIEKNGWYEE